MRRTGAVFTLLVFSALNLFALPAQAQEPPPRTMAAGFNYLGGQLRYAFKPAWSGEIRYMTGTVDGNSGYTTTQVIGLRSYRFFNARNPYRFFLGGELAAFNASDNQRGVFYKASGAAAGGFAGFEYFFGRRLALDVDAGPYIFSIKEKLFGGKDMSFDFVLNASLNIYLF